MFNQNHFIVLKCRYSRCFGAWGVKLISNRPVPPSEEDLLFEVGQLYQRWCHNQPLCLFRQENFPESLRSRDQELRLAINSLTRRFPPGQLTPSTRQEIDSISSQSRRLVVERVAIGKVKLSTLQALCLLSVACFAGEWDAMILKREIWINRYERWKCDAGRS